MNAFCTYELEKSSDFSNLCKVSPTQEINKRKCILLGCDDVNLEDSQIKKAAFHKLSFKSQIWQLCWLCVCRDYDYASVWLWDDTGADGIAWLLHPKRFRAPGTRSFLDVQLPASNMERVNLFLVILGTYFIYLDNFQSHF